MERFPEAAYVNERAAFVLRGVANARVTARLDGKQIAEGVMGASVLEMSLRLDAPGDLAFTQGSTSVVFDVLKPESESAVLEEKDGYLHSARGPALLLAVHVFPPKHNRRWEFVKLVGRLFSKESRPVVSSGVLIGAEFLSGAERRGLDRLTGVRAGFWTHAQATPCLSELNGLIAGRSALPPADIAVVALSAEDCERGVDEAQYEAKLDWYLQALKRRGWRRVFVVAPPFNARQQERFPVFPVLIGHAAKACGAVYVSPCPPGSDREIAAATWAESVMRVVSRTVRCR